MIGFPSEPLLLGAGPTNCYPGVYQALSRPLVGLSDPALHEMSHELVGMLRNVWNTTNQVAIPIAGTGSAAMETAVMNFVGPGDDVVIGENGGFATRITEMAKRAGARVHVVKSTWGGPLQAQDLLAAHPKPAAIFVVHSETTTGSLSDLSGLVDRDESTLLIADCVTSLGGVPVHIDEWKVDVAFSGAQKCLGVPPGISTLTVSPRALDRRRPRANSWYLDASQAINFATGDAPRLFAHTSPISMLYALHAGLKAVLGEGLEACWERHLVNGLALQEGLQEMGLELFADAGSRLPQLTTVVVPEDLPDGMAEADVRTRLREEFGIEISAGVAHLAGKIWRIGLMGPNANPRSVHSLLSALKIILKR